MPTLHWVGKEKVVNHHHDVPFRLLDKKYTFTPNEGTPTNSTGNKIIHGDNLEALKSLLPEFEGKINCIYIDPPYNTGNEGWVYNDNVNDPKLKKWLGEVVGKEGEDLSRHDKWLCMMYPRLKLLHRLLAEDGAIFVSIDDNESGNIRLVLDEIFGVCSFISNVVWQKKYTIANDARWLSNNHDHILIYAKDKNCWRPNKMPRTDEMNVRYRNPDNHPKGPWKATPLHAKSGSEVNKGFAYAFKNRVIWSPPLGTFPRFSVETLKRYDDGNEIWFGIDGKSSPSRKTFLSELTANGTPCSTIWLHTDVGHNHEAREEAKSFNDETPFETPKPTRLLERIIHLSTNPNSLILDSFAGSGTTAHAVLKLNAQDGGNRRFILCEMMPYAETITAERVRRVANGYGEGTKAMPGTGGSFDYYEVGPALFTEDKNLNEQVGIDAIRNYVTYTESIPQAKQCAKDNLVSPHAIGASDTTLWLFYYERTRVTTLDLDFLASLNINAHIQSGNKRPEQYIIYADKCALDQDFLTSHNIIFKRIPRDITRF